MLDRNESSARGSNGWKRAYRAIAASAAALIGCIQPAGDESARVDPVVYGEDDRREVFEHPDARMRQIGAQSIVALMRRTNVNTGDRANVQFNSQTLASAQNLCAGQRFATQPTAAFCSGTLIDDNLVLTAGHCIDNATDCANTQVVFNYFYASAGTLQAVAREDVFNCAEVVARRLDGAGSSPNLDYAVIRLERAATPRFTPATVRSGTAPMAIGASIGMIGFGSGIPAKIDTGGTVRDARANPGDFFLATTDSFGGNSGSGVFDMTSREVVGILVRGDTDYVMQGGCQVVNRCGSDACSGESINYVHHAIAALCGASVSERLCGTRPTCGNSRCEPGETTAACAADCPAPRCGDGICDVDETGASCAADCAGPAVPAGWTCNRAYYAVGDDCDCNCGVRDPDCDNASLRILGCAAGQVCGGTGQCTSGEGADAGPDSGTGTAPRPLCSAPPARTGGSRETAALFVALSLVAIAGLARRSRLTPPS